MGSLTRIQKNEMYKSAIFIYQSDIFSFVHLDVLYNIYSVFFRKLIFLFIFFVFQIV